MGQEYGGRNASGRENGGQSSHSDSPTIKAAGGVPLAVGSFSIDDAIAMHLVDCDQCREAIQNLRPVPMGGKSGHCDTYWELQLMRARYEGEVNNIVAYTELGDEAPKGRALE
jgi:hypothetical protein